MELTIHNMIGVSVNKFKSKKAIIYGDKSLTFGEVDERANRIANGLLELGLIKGDRCALLFYNCAEWLELYLGMSKIGIIPVPINFRLVPEEIKYIINNSEPKAIIYGEAFKNTILSIRSEIPSVNHLIEQNQTENEYEKWLEKQSADDPKTFINEMEPFFLGYTSGTTGFPKGAVVSQKNLVVHHLTLAKELAGINHKDKMLLIMPQFHSNSTWFLQIMAMNGGTTYVYPSTGFNPEEVLKIIDREKITFTSIVPTMLTMILNLPDEIKNKYDVSSLRVLLCSSAPMMHEVKEKTLNYFKGINLFEGYGATESGTVTMLSPEENGNKLRSVGKPIVGQEVRLLDDQGQDVKVGEIGEIYIKGSSVLLVEYWKNPKATRESYRDGWLSVGDMGRMDEDGYLYLEDRKKDIIISGGENVYPTEVENAIARHPSVSVVAVIGVPDNHWGERVHAVIELKPNSTLTENEIIDFCKDKLAGYKRPKSIDFVYSIPKNATGKIVRRTIREPYWENVNKK